MDVRKYPHERYDELVKQTVTNMQKLAQEKGGEYAGDEDRLANFRRNAHDAGCSMELVWRIYAGKHWDAISQYVKDIVEGKTRPRSESISGRLDDLIVYAVLMKAIVEEREEAMQPKLPFAIPPAMVIPPAPPRRYPQTDPFKIS